MANKFFKLVSMESFEEYLEDSVEEVVEEEEEEEDEWFEPSDFYVEEN